MNIPFVSFEKMHNEIKVEVLAKMQEIYEKNWFIQGPEVTAFEEEFAAYCGTKYCVGCGNGLDALFLALKAYGIKEGDEVIVPSNTFIATALAVSYTGATPVFVEPEENYFNIEDNIFNSYSILPLLFYNENIAVNNDITGLTLDCNGNINFSAIRK